MLGEKRGRRVSQKKRELTKTKQRKKREPHSVFHRGGLREKRAPQ